MRVKDFQGLEVALSPEESVFVGESSVKYLTPFVFEIHRKDQEPEVLSTRINFKYMITKNSRFAVISGNRIKIVAPPHFNIIRESLLEDDQEYEPFKNAN